MTIYRGSGNAGFGTTATSPAANISISDIGSLYTSATVEDALQEEATKSNTHIAAHSAHGVAGTLVGDSDTQTLTNKSIALGSNTVTGTIAQFNAACTDADFTYTVPTIAALRLLTPPSTLDRIYLKAYADAGDGGHGWFRPVTGAATSTYVDNGGTIIVPTGGDGSAAWLREYTGPIQLKWFGAKPDKVTDALSAVNNAITYAATFSSASEYTIIDLDGGDYAVSDQISLAGRIELYNGSFTAIGTWAAGKHVIYNPSTYKPRLTKIKVDGSFTAGGINAFKRIILTDVDVSHFPAENLVTPMYGVWNQGGVNSQRLNVYQWEYSDTGFDVQVNRTGIGIFTNTVDSQWIDTVTNFSKVPLRVGANASFNRFTNLHTYNGSGTSGTIHSDPINFEMVNGAGKTEITQWYCDNGYIDLYTDNLIADQVMFLYDLTKVSLTSHVRLYASQANDVLDNLRFSSYYPSETLTMFKFYANGYSWAANTTSIEAYTTDIEFLGATESVVVRGTTGDSTVRTLISSHQRSVMKFIGNLTTALVQIGADVNDFVVRIAGSTAFSVKSDGSTNIPKFQTAGDTTGGNVTVVSADAGKTFNVQNGAAAVTYTLPADAPAGWWIRIQVKGAGVFTIAAPAGGYLRGVLGGTNTVPQYGSCLITCGRNSGGSTAEFYLEGSFV